MNPDYKLYVVEYQQENRRKPTGWNKPVYWTYTNWDKLSQDIAFHLKFLDNNRQVRFRLFKVNGYEEINFLPDDFKYEPLIGIEHHG
jgi:hypothetical protein